jgi:hypothetical protein
MSVAESGIVGNADYKKAVAKILMSGTKYWIRVRNVDETAYTLDTYPGHSLDTCNISIDISDAFLINIWLSWHSLVYFDFLTYKWYHMLIAQPLRPITNHITACFTYSILPTFSLSYHWRLRYFRLYHMVIDLLLWYITKVMTTT